MLLVLRSGGAELTIEADSIIGVSTNSEADSGRVYFPSGTFITIDANSAELVKVMLQNRYQVENSGFTTSTWEENEPEETTT